MKLEWMFGAGVLVALAAGVGYWAWSQGSRASSTVDAGAGSGGRAADEGAAQTVLPTPSAPAAEVVTAPTPAAAPDLLDVLARWVRQRLHVCPLTKARLPAGRGYIRFLMSSDFALLDARLVDIESGADILDDCFAKVVSELKPRAAARRDAAAPNAAPDAPGDTSAPDAGASELTVWWPLRPGDGKMPGADAAPEVQMPGVEMMLVPYYYPIVWLPAAGLAGPWLGLCPDAREVTLASTPDEENSDFVHVSVDGCGPDPDFRPAIRRPGLSASQPIARADVRVTVKSPTDETDIRLGGEHYHLWQTPLETETEKETFIPDDILALRSGTTVQVLATDDPYLSSRVVWAGDLDRDGRIDLVIHDWQEGGRIRLFLSNANRTLPVLLAAERWLPQD